MTMPFGKYHGIDIAALPDEYIFWLAEGVDLYGRLRDAVELEYGRRTYQRRRERASSPPTPPRRPRIAIMLHPNELPIARRVFDAGYRQVARSLHPDAGGDLEEMKRLNALVDSVRGQLELLEVAR